MQPGTKQGQLGTRQGQLGTKWGQPGTKQGQPGTKRDGGIIGQTPKKITQTLGTKKTMQPLGKKNHARDNWVLIGPNRFKCVHRGPNWSI